jgi:hypothetical protein
MDCFESFKIPVIVRVFITWLTFVASFFSMKFFTYLKRTGRAQSFNTLDALINFPILCNTLHLQSELGQTEKNFHITSTHRDFLQCEFMDALPMKLENQLIIRLYHIEKVYLNGEYYISSNCSGRGVHGFYPFNRYIT